jgi:hypothetical protein
VVATPRSRERLTAGVTAGVAPEPAVVGADAGGAAVALESVRVVSVGVVPVVPVELVVPEPPPICTVPFEPDAVLPPPVPVPIGPPAVVPPAPAVGVTCRPDDWTAPLDAVAVLPPPTCAAPVESVALLPLVLGPGGEATVTVWPAPVAEAAGDALGDDDWTAPLDPDAVLPPPT